MSSSDGNGSANRPNGCAILNADVPDADDPPGISTGTSPTRSTPAPAAQITAVQIPDVQIPDVQNSEIGISDGRGVDMAGIGIRHGDAMQKRIARREIGIPTFAFHAS